MVLLAAEYANEWKAVFSFGPVDDPRGYGAGLWGALPYDPNNDAASRLRAPVHWLPSIAGPVFVIEGDKQGNLSSLQAMRDINRNPQVHFAVGRGCTHFSILRPGSERIAQVIARDAAGSLEGADGLNLVC